MPLGRVERLQIMLTDDELAAIDDWRFERFLQWLQRRQQQRQLMKEGGTVDETTDNS